MTIKKSRASQVKVPSSSRKCLECVSHKVKTQSYVATQEGYNLINIDAIDRLFPQQRSQQSKPVEIDKLLYTYVKC